MSTKFLYSTISSLEANISLIQWILEHYPKLNHSITQKLIRIGQFKINKKKVNFKTILQENDVIQIPIELINNFKSTAKQVVKNNFQPDLYKKEIKLLQNSIIYQDDNYLILNKPAGIAVQGGSKTYFHIGLALPFLRFSAPSDPLLVHRLDKDTSGILILARNKATCQYMFEVFKQKNITKIYYCLVYPFLEQAKAGVITANLLKQGVSNAQKIIIDTQGKVAITKYKVLAEAHNIALLEVQPLSGRTHQIRVHMAQYLHTPIIGDFKYGATPIEAKINYHNLYLHAKFIEFKDINGKTIKVNAPLNHHFQTALKQLNFKINL